MANKVNRTTPNQHGAPGVSPVHSPPRPDAGPLRRWAMLLAGLAAILLLAFGGIPLFQQLKPVREVREAINRREIDATALFYTESHTSAEAESAIRNALQFPTTRRNIRPLALAPGVRPKNADASEPAANAVGSLRNKCPAKRWAQRVAVSPADRSREDRKAWQK